jgi:hypothetical protein
MGTNFDGSGSAVIRVLSFARSSAAGAIVEVLREIEAEQAQTAAPIVRHGKVGSRSIEDFAGLATLHFVTKERLYEDLSFDGFRAITK